MSKKKIAILGLKYWPSKGGTSRVVEDIILQLYKDFEFTVYCYQHPEAENNIPGVRTVQFPEPPLGGAGVFYFFFQCCIHILRSKDYDIVHVHKTDAAFFLPLLTRKYTCIATSHEAPYRRDKWTLIGKTYFQLMERVFMNSNAVLTSISKPLSEYYEAKYRKSVLFIPNGVDTDVKPAREEVESIFDEFSIKEDFIFFAARRIMATKGCHTVLKAMKRIEYPHTLVIAGDTTQLPKYTKQLASLSKYVPSVFIGFVDAKEKLLAIVERAKFFIFPSEAEGMSIMLLEVASMGTPIICSDIPENMQVFNESEVLFFRNKDEADLAEKLLYAENHLDDMYLRARKAKLKVLEHYSRQRVSRSYSELYNQVDQTKIRVS